MHVEEVVLLIPNTYIFKVNWNNNKKIFSNILILKSKSKFKREICTKRQVGEVCKDIGKVLEISKYASIKQNSW